MGLKRQTQIIYPKDIAHICMRLGVGPGRTILEAGCGSGALTIALSWFAGPNGKIVSHDAREEFVRLARRNLDWAQVGEMFPAALQPRTPMPCSWTCASRGIVLSRLLRP